MRGRTGGGGVGFSIEEVEVGDVELDAWVLAEIVDELLGIGADAGDDWAGEDAGFDADFDRASGCVEREDFLLDVLGEVEIFGVGGAGVLGELVAEFLVFDEFSHGVGEGGGIFNGGEEGGVVVL